MAKRTKARQRASAARSGPQIAPPAPADISPAARAWVSRIEADYELEPHQREVLKLAAHHWDRVQEARALIARDGLCFTLASGRICPHPATVVEKNSSALFAKLLNDLRLDVDPPASGGSNA